MTGRVVHVEMHDGRAFCDAPGAAQYQYDGVDQRDWHADPAAVERSGCMACLQKIVELGAAASKRQRRLARSPGPVAEVALGQMFTAKERMALAFLAAGLSNKMIADRMKTSTHTAKFHVANIMRKLHAENRAHAVAIAASLGFVGRRDGLWSL